MKFNLFANLVVLCINMYNGKKYILSLDKKDIKLPQIQLNKNQAINMNKTLIEYLRSLNISENLATLIPQMICLDTEYISSDTDAINVVFGFLVDYNNDISKDVCWFEFDYGIPNKYSNLIFEVVQKLQ